MEHFSTPPIWLASIIPWPRYHVRRPCFGVLKVFAAQLSLDLDASRRPTDYEEIEFVDSVENPAEGTLNCARWLVKHGYSNEDIAKVLGENSMRVLRQVW